MVLHAAWWPIWVGGSVKVSLSGWGAQLGQDLGFAATLRRGGSAGICRIPPAVMVGTSFWVVGPGDQAGPVAGGILLTVNSPLRLETR